MYYRCYNTYKQKNNYAIFIEIKPVLCVICNPFEVIIQTDFLWFTFGRNSNSFLFYRFLAGNKHRYCNSYSKRNQNKNGIRSVIDCGYQVLKIYFCTAY